MSKKPMSKKLKAIHPKCQGCDLVILEMNGGGCKLDCDPNDDMNPLCPQNSEYAEPDPPGDEEDDF